MAMEVSGIILGGANATAGSASKLTDLTDVAIQGTLAGGQNLRYNSALKLWQNSDITPDIYQYIQNNLQGTNGILVSSSNGKHSITFGFTASGDVKPVSVVDYVLDLQLVDVNDAPGEYGGSTMIPVITVDSKGRVTRITTEPSAAGGSVTYVALTGGSTGLTVSGGPIMTSGTLALGGCLNVSAGGSGASQLTGYIRGNGTQPFTASPSISGSDISGDITGTAGAAVKLKTARKITIGEVARNFDGTADISWTLASMGAVSKAGDIMTGPLTLSGDPTANLHAVTKQYLDQRVSTSTPIGLVGLAGQVPYVKDDNTSTIEPGYVLHTGQFVSNDVELAAAKTRMVDQATIFNTWTRFSHVSTNEAQPAIPDETASWSYLNGVITSTVNSQSYIGFISSDRYQSYTHEVRLSSTATDDDAIGVILAWYKDPVKGREYTLSAIRSPGGLALLPEWNVSTWDIVYNFSRSDAWVVSSGTLSVKWGNGAYGADPAAAGYTTNLPLGGWADFGAVGTKVKVIRDGDIFTAETTDLGTDTYIPGSLLTVDLTSDPRLEKFRGAAPIGYSCASQPASSFTVLELTDPKAAIYDVRDGSIWRYTATTDWVMSATDTIVSDIGIGRFLLDSYTKNVYFVQPEGVVAVSRGTAATYSQTIAAGAFYEIDARAVFGPNIDARSLTIQVKVLDTKAGSPTQGMYINSETVATAAIRGDQYVRVYNDYTTSLDFFITLKL